MMKNQSIHIKIDTRLKKKVDSILSKLGLNTSQAIKLFYNQIALNQGLPFSVKIPNAVTSKTLQQTDRGDSLNYCENIEDLFRKLEIE